MRERSRPVSSRVSRRTAWREVSPDWAAPPGISHQPGAQALVRARHVMRKRPSGMRMAARTER